ncbi:hypothetical protein TNCV_299381 [Trichonephila clavipes]|nr:hypothetical protein TNCV_299381 [Trichonephila clavipes]
MIVQWRNEEHGPCPAPAKLGLGPPRTMPPTPAKRGVRYASDDRYLGLIPNTIFQLLHSKSYHRARRILSCDTMPKPMTMRNLTAGHVQAGTTSVIRGVGNHPPDDILLKPSKRTVVLLPSSQITYRRSNYQTAYLHLGC